MHVNCYKRYCMIKPQAPVLPITEDTMGVQPPCWGKGWDKAARVSGKEDVSTSSSG